MEEKQKIEKPKYIIDYVDELERDPFTYLD